MGKQIVLSADLMESLFRLDRKSQKLAMNAIDKLREDHMTFGLQMHKLDKASDGNMRSVRANDDLRIILNLFGDQIVLLHINHHDAAYKWAEKRIFKQNEFGNAFIYENFDVSEVKSDVAGISQYERPPLMKGKEFNTKDLVRIGLSEEHAAHIMEISDEEILLEFVGLIPDELQESVIDLYTGVRSITEIFAQMQEESVLKSDYLLHEQNARRFVILDPSVAWSDWADYEKWKVFLHPDQKRIVEASFNGPALIKGGPGTGKTIVGIHRAVWLAQNVFTDEKDVIVFCAFNKNLIRVVREKLAMLCKNNAILERIQVDTVDQLISNGLKAGGRKVHFYNNRQFDELLEEAYSAYETSYSLSDLKFEYREVIQRYDLKTLEEYFDVKRLGMPPMLKSQREKIWPFFEKISELKKERKCFDFEDRAQVYIKDYERGIIKPQYASIIIDEAQDLTPIKLKALSIMCRNDRNNLMILCDPNQRIYQLKSWEGEIGIRIIGRTRNLCVNYRTTHEIKTFAEEQFQWTRKNRVIDKGYKSISTGPKPVVKHFSSISKLKAFMVSTLNRWQTEENDLKDSAIIAPYKYMGDVKRGLSEANLPFNEINVQNDNGEYEGVICLINIENCKGLEYKNVFLFNYVDSDDDLDYEKLEAEDLIEQRKAELYECRKYVATTRAKEELIIGLLETEE